MSKADLYQTITDKIIAQLESGVFPWAQPWDVRCVFDGLPMNGQTKKTYSGVNILLLWTDQLDRGFTHSRYMTFKQAQKLGGCVRKGEKSTKVVFVDSFTPASEKEKAEASPDYKARSRFFLKQYAVFNVEQIDGLDADVMGKAQALPERQPHAEAEALITATGADFRIAGGEAFYSPSHDFIQVPDQRQFKQQIDYYRTALHELTHWTGHERRLDRKIRNQFGSKDYAREELVAEMGAAFLCAAKGITPTVRHADYLGSWLKVLKEDNRAIFRAASQASKAADYILALEADKMQQAA